MSCNLSDLSVACRLFLSECLKLKLDFTLQDMLGTAPSHLEGEPPGMLVRSTVPMQSMYC